MLFGEDINATTEDLPAVLSFQHKLIQEYLAAVYIAEIVKLDKTSTFLTEALPTWEAIETHREVVQFACGILAEIDARPITSHVAKVLAQHTHNQLNTGVKPSIITDFGKQVKPLSLLRLFEREGKVSPEINPYLCEYPACGRPLAEVLANTELAYITGIDKNDTLRLNPSPAKIIVKLICTNSYWFDRLWHSLCQICAGVLAYNTKEVKSANATKLSNFPQLKYININGLTCNYSETVMEDLAESVDAWGPKPSLVSCKLVCVPISRSIIRAVGKCSCLTHLHLILCNLHDKLSILISSLHPALRHLELSQCSLLGSDVDQITNAIREGRLTSLQELEIQRNPVGEVAMACLLEALVSTRPKVQLNLWLHATGVDENGKYTWQSEQFINGWKAKLTSTDIKVIQ